MEHLENGVKDLENGVNDSQVDKVLDYLEAHPYEIISRKQLYEAVWGVPAYGNYKRNIYTAISQARKLLEEGSQILSVKEMGYIFIGKGGWNK